MSTPWITNEELAGHTGSEIAFNPVASLYMEAACDCIRLYIDQQVDYETGDTVVLSGTGTTTLMLPEMPVIEVSSITKDDDAAPIDLTTYIQQGRSQIHLIDGNVWLPTSRYTVVYSHGWALTALDEDTEAGILRIPATLRLRALEVAATALVSGTTGVGGVKKEAIGRYSYELADTGSGVYVGLTEEQEVELRRFMQEGVA
jgi:hypothetical protein